MATGLGCKLHWTIASSPLFLSGGLLLLPIYCYVCTSHFFNMSVKQLTGIIPLAHTYCCLKLHGAVWQSNMQALAGLSSISPLRWLITKNLVSQLPENVFILHNLDSGGLQKRATYTTSIAIIIPKTQYSTICIQLSCFFAPWLRL